MPDLRFSPAHIWARVDGEYATLGVSDYLQDQLGDITAVELADLGDVLRAARKMGAVRSEEAMTVLDSPLTGEVVDVNQEVLVSPDIINAEPYESGWLLRVHIDDPSELDDLMAEEEYTDLTTEV